MPTQMHYGLAGLAGSLIALTADVIQKELASSVVKISSSLSLVLKLPITPLWTVLILALAGAIYCAFRAKASGEAFTVGLGILSLIMTVTPYSAAPTLPSAPDKEETISHAVWTPETVFAVHTTAMPQARLAADFEVVQFQTAGDEVLRGVKIRLLYPPDGKISGKVTLEVFDAMTKAKVGSIATEGTQFNFGLAPGDYVIRVTAPGYQIVDDQLRVQADTGKDIELSKSSIPVSVQRLLVPAR